MLAVLYLLFNEGYSASSGEELIRAGLCDEAIRLTRLLCRLLPDEPEADALLALMLLQHSRRDARVDSDGDLITLEDQDRGLWHSDEIEEAKALLAHSGPLTGMGALPAAAGPLTSSSAIWGPYRAQAEIALCHTREPIDWPRIAALYAGARAGAALTRGAPQPRRGGGDGRRPRRGANAGERARPAGRARRVSPALRHPRRPAAAPRRPRSTPGWNTSVRWHWRRPRPNGASSAGGSTSSAV